MDINEQQVGRVSAEQLSQKLTGYDIKKLRETMDKESRRVDLCLYLFGLCFGSVIIVSMSIIIISIARFL